MRQRHPVRETSGPQHFDHEAFLLVFPRVLRKEAPACQRILREKLFSGHAAHSASSTSGGGPCQPARVHTSGKSSAIRMCAAAGTAESVQGLRAVEQERDARLMNRLQNNNCSNYEAPHSFSAQSCCSQRDFFAHCICECRRTKAARPETLRTKACSPPPRSPCRDRSWCSKARRPSARPARPTSAVW